MNVSFCEQVESSDVSYAVDDNVQGYKRLDVSTRKQLQTSSILYNTGMRTSSQDLNSLDIRITHVGPKGLDRNVSDNKSDLNFFYDGTKNVQEDGLVHGIEPKGSDTVVSNSNTVHQYDKTTLRPRKKSKGNLTSSGKTMFSRAAKQGLTVSGRENDETRCLGSEKKALPIVVVVRINSVHQLRFRRKRKMNTAGAEPVTSKQLREVKKLGVPTCGMIDNNICTVGLEKAVLPVSPRQI